MGENALLCRQRPGEEEGTQGLSCQWGEDGDEDNDGDEHVSRNQDTPARHGVIWKC